MLTYVYHPDVIDDDETANAYTDDDDDMYIAIALAHVC